MKELKQRLAEEELYIRAVDSLREAVEKHYPQDLISCLEISFD